MSVDVSRKNPVDVWNGSTGPRDERKAPIGDRLSCPECGSTRIWRSGFRRPRDGSKVQVYQCGECYHKFTDPNSRRRAFIDDGG